jgi:mRNA interferase HigB
MNVIARPKLCGFQAEFADARAWLDQWWTVAKRAVWTRLDDVRTTYPFTDQYGRCLIFNCKGNKHRLIVGVSYATNERSGTLFIKHFLTHAEYDKDYWKESC